MNKFGKCAMQILLSIFLALGFCVTAKAASADSINISITPYAWLPSVSGKIEARGYTANVDAPFTTLTKHLNFAGMLAIDLVAYDKVGFTGNINFAMLGDNSAVRGVSLDSKSTMILSDMAMFYRLGTTPLNESGSAYIKWDLLAGARVWDLKAKLDVWHPLREFTVTQHETWVDPIVGARAWLRFNKKWALWLHGDIGGFDLNSRVTWSASSLLAYSLWEHGRVLAGYRGVGVNYETGSGSGKFRADATLHGPLVGLSIQF